MNQIDIEDSAARTEVYENEYVDTVTGRQSEEVDIDGRKPKGILDIDPTSIELVFGGSNENVTGAFYTDKKYWPDGNYPSPKNSVLTMITGSGQVREYQITVVNGAKDNRSQLTIGLGAYTNRK